MGLDVYNGLGRTVDWDAGHPSGPLASLPFPKAWPLLLWKRAISVLVSVLGLVLASPLMAIIALAIKLDDGGPVLFRQKRVGKDGRLFTLNKFRTLKRGADPDGRFRPVQENDSRITRMGRWLRRTHLDELPQFANVLHGDMDLVGPRPFVVDQEEECAANIPFYEWRWRVKPGATGWAQVNRGYCATLQDNAEKLAYDLFYIKNMSVGFDLAIILRTLKILLLRHVGR
jgi:lipopolysaccharide/colanic/teichoic acid biosynthesis glycosyltransferase